MKQEGHCYLLLNLLLCPDSCGQVAPPHLHGTGKWVARSPAPPLLPSPLCFCRNTPIYRSLPALLSLEPGCRETHPLADLSPRLLLTSLYPFDVEPSVLGLWGFLGFVFLKGNRKKKKNDQGFKSLRIWVLWAPLHHRPPRLAPGPGSFCGNPLPYSAL